VVKRAVAHNRASPAPCRNQPPWPTTPGRSDNALPSRLMGALMLVYVHVPDRVIVGEGEPPSMGGRWLL
ncbi:hypothetical protein EWW49_28540, partial [Pseudomonas syringae]